MPRPLRYDLPLTRRTVYVHPEVSAAIDRWTSDGHGRSPGQLVDLLVRKHFAEGVDSAGWKTGRPSGKLAHDWAAHPVFGKRCTTCMKPVGAVGERSECTGVSK